MNRYYAEEFLKSEEFENFRKMIFFFSISQVSKKIKGCYNFKKSIAEEISSEAILRFVECLLNEKQIECKEAFIRKVVLNLIANRGRKAEKWYNKILSDSDTIYNEGHSIDDFAPEDLLVLEGGLEDFVKDAKLTPIESKVIHMLNIGYNKKAIAERLEVHQSYITQVVKSAKKKFL